MMEWLITRTPLFYFVQSLWRDEVFSIFVAEKPIFSVLPKLTFEPPVYYVLLHFWIKIFGNGEIATRSLSFIGVVLAALVFMKLADREYPGSWITWFAPIFFLLNPMVLYYAFEVRTYGWYIFFATLSVYAYLSERKVLGVIANVLGFYTHTYFVFVILVQGVHRLYVITHQSKHRIAAVMNDPFLRSMLISSFLMLPWVIRLVFELPRLKQSWYFPVDISLIYSVLGNMFVGYEGTPWYGWLYTRYLSLCLLVMFFLAYRSKKLNRNTLYLYLQVFLPLVIVIGISFIKPLFVNRYLIPVTIAEILLVCTAIHALKPIRLQYLTGGLWLGFVILFNSWYPLQHPKLPLRDTIRSIHPLMDQHDVIYAETPLVLFESMYYSPDRSRVFLYNPSGTAFPWYVGDTVYSADMARAELPEYPHRAFLVREDGTFDVAYRLPVSDTLIAAD